MPHCVTDQRKWRRSLVHRGTRNKNFPLQKFWLKSQARITTTRKIFDLIETSFVISNFPNIETNILLPIQKTGGRKHQLEIKIGFTLHNCKLDDRTVHFKHSFVKVCTFTRDFVRIQFYFYVLKLCDEWCSSLALRNIFYITGYFCMAELKNRRNEEKSQQNK